MNINSISNVNTPFNTGIVSPGHLTPEGMMLYLETRLGGLDEQINVIMNKQKQSEAGRKALQETLNLLASCPEEGGEIDARKLADGFDNLAQTFGVAASHEIEKVMPDSIRNRIGDGNNDGNWGSGYKSGSPDAENPPLKLSKEDLQAAKSQFETMIKDIESGAELEMIKLQSLMSARNTAISLSTNMASGIGKGTEAITNNVAR